MRSSETFLKRGGFNAFITFTRNPDSGRDVYIYFGKKLTRVNALISV